MSATIGSVYHKLAYDYIGRPIYIPYTDIPHKRHVDDHYASPSQKADNLLTTTPPPIDPLRGRTIDKLV